MATAVQRRRQILLRLCSLRMPLRFLRSSGSSLVLTGIALACGVALVCAIDLVNRAVLRAFEEVVDTMAGRAALQVSTGGDGLFPEEVAARVAAVPGVELAVPVVSASAFTTDANNEQLTVLGVEITNEAAVRVYEASDTGGIDIGDPLMFLNQPDSVVLTRAFAERQNLRVGDAIALDTPAGRRQFTVRSLLEPKGVARVYGGNLAVMDLYAAEAAFTRPGFINRVDVVVARDADVDRAATAVASALPAGLKVEAPAQRKADLQKVMQSFQVLLRGVGLVGLVAAFLIIFNRLQTVFEERRWQLGIVMAVGVARRTVCWDLIKESFLVGTAGVVVGIPAGVGLGYLLLPVIATTAALNYKLVAPDAGLRVSAGPIAVAAGLGIGASVLAAALAAWRTTREVVVETLRTRGIEQPEGATGAAVVLRATVLGAATAAVALQYVEHSPSWGLLATGLLALGAAVAAQPIVTVLLPSLAPVLRRLIGRSGRLAMAALLGNPRRVGLTVATLGVGLGAVFWLWTVARSFEKSVYDALASALQADVVVTSAHIASGFLEAPLDEQLASDIARLPHVAVVAGWHALEWPYDGGPVGLSAYDARYYTDPAFGRLPLVGRHTGDVWQRVAGGTAVVISSSFALNLHVGVDDTITLQTPSGPLRLPVAGITEDFVAPRGTIELSRELYKRYWHDAQVTRIFVRTIPGADISRLRADIARDFGSRYGLRILSAADLLAYFTTQVRRAFGVIPVLAGLILFVVLLGMADTLAASVFERTRDLGTARALGVQPQHLQRMLFAEGTIIGILGLLLAGVAGLALGVLWVQATFPYLLGWVLEVHVPYLQLAGVALATLPICIVAAIVPGRRAARISPADALRYE